MNRVPLLNEENRRKLIREPKRKKKVNGNAGRRKYNDEYIDPLDNRRLNLNNDTLFILSLPFMFQDKEIFT